MSASGDNRIYLPNSKSCFACGEENGAGLQLRFFVENETTMAWFQPKAHHCGYPNVLHGGVIAALLDETIAWAANRALARMTLTAELKLRYRRPAPGDRKLLVWAEVTKSNRRIAYGNGAVVDEAGEEYARAEGSFIPLSVEQTRAIDSHLVYRGGEERVFDGLKERS